MVIQTTISVTNSDLGLIKKLRRVVSFPSLKCRWPLDATSLFFESKGSPEKDFNIDIFNPVMLVVEIL